MKGKYSQSPAVSAQTRFTGAPMSDIEFSKFTALSNHWTTFNAGGIIPVACLEVLPHDWFSIDLDFVIRQNTVLTPTMDNMIVDYYAFFVPNRVVNQSWVNVMGENTSGEWVAPEVSLVPLYTTRTGAQDVQIPVGSIADYYGYPTQEKMPAKILQMCNDLKARGYVEIYNTRFRDQNYQPPIPYSKLNVYEGFLEAGTDIPVDPSSFSNPNGDIISSGSSDPDGSVYSGAITKALYGEGSVSLSSSMGISNRISTFDFLGEPLKANKLHDYFTSVLPSPQKGVEVVFSLAESAPVNFSTVTGVDFPDFGGTSPLRFRFSRNFSNAGSFPLYANSTSTSTDPGVADIKVSTTSSSVSLGGDVSGWNLQAFADLSQSSAISVSDLRQGIAIQQVYETLARGGSRYREYINSFFGLETDNPFSDIPSYLGHIRRNLDLYQTAQTSPSQEGSTPQGNLAAFGYTNNGGHLFDRTFIEHGYIHIFAVVRHRNVYSSFMSRDNFRMNTLDFYMPQLANISEQPVYAREINPFVSDSDQVFGYQEAWAEYRYVPDRCSGLMRAGGSANLSLWNYADEFDSGLKIADGDWLKSNSAEVLDRSLAIKSSEQPQFKGRFTFIITMNRPMPTYSVPGLDIL